jgi:hypothetical protein
MVLISLLNGAVSFTLEREIALKLWQSARDADLSEHENSACFPHKPFPTTSETAKTLGLTAFLRLLRMECCEREPARN